MSSAKIKLLNYKYLSKRLLKQVSILDFLKLIFILSGSKYHTTSYTCPSLTFFRRFTLLTNVLLWNKIKENTLTLLYFQEHFDYYLCLLIKEYLNLWPCYTGLCKLELPYWIFL